MTRKVNVAESVEYRAGINWRFSIIDEPGDIVMRLDHSDDGKWHNVVRLEQSSHEMFHIHLPGHNGAIDISPFLSDEEKVKIGVATIQKHVSERAVFCKDDYCPSSDAWEEIKNKMLNKAVRPGTTSSSISITATARIITNFDFTVTDGKGNIKHTGRA